MHRSQQTLITGLVVVSQVGWGTGRGYRGDGAPAREGKEMVWGGEGSPGGEGGGWGCVWGWERVTR